MQNVPEKEIMGHIADLFKGFADPTRVHILSLLLVKSELCVTDIAEDAFSGCPESMVIVAPEGSFAAEYAGEHGFAE